MTTTNNGRPLPWHDTPRCEAPDRDGPKGVCGLAMVPVSQMSNGYGGPAGSRIACSGCGEGRVGTAAEVRQAERAQRAWEMYESGLVHPDRGCEKCNGALTLDRFRLCAPCVAKDNAERQACLFPGVA
jgi:hypothetical protein